MKKIAKAALITAAGCAAAYLAAGEAAYEGVMNIKLSRLLTQKLHLENKPMMDILLNHEVYTSSYEWYDALDLTDTVIVDSTGKHIHGYILKQPEYSKKWAVVMHGYCGDPRAEAPFAKHFYDNGYNIVFPHMRGHEHDESRYCSMGFYDKDIVCGWIDFVVGEDSESEIILHGTSMGAATVMLVTGEGIPKNVRAAIADCGFSSCRKMFEGQMKAMKLPSFPFLNAFNTVSRLRGNLDINKCSPVESIKHSTTPTLFIHGTDDDLVPYYMLDEVYDACSAEKDRLDVPGAVHTAAVAVDEKGYFAKVDEFVAKYVK